MLVLSEQWESAWGLPLQLPWWLKIETPDSGSSAWKETVPSGFLAWKWKPSAGKTASWVRAFLSPKYEKLYTRPTCLTNAYPAFVVCQVPGAQHCIDASLSKPSVCLIQDSRRRTSLLHGRVLQNCGEWFWGRWTQVLSEKSLFSAGRQQSLVLKSVACGSHGLN